MNIQDYIASGILESFLLGHLSPDQNLEVEAMAARYPEIKQELESLERDLESLAQINAVSPTQNLKDNILAKITEEELPVTTPVDVGQRNNSTVIASIIGILLLAGILYFCARNQKNLQRQLTQTTERISQLQGDNQTILDQLNRVRNDLQIMTDPDFERIKMAGQAFAPNAFAQVYWDKNSQEVYLNPLSLTAPSQNQQYQLWAIGSQGPVSMGVFDLPPDSTLLKMLSTGDAAAFAITLEPRGGLDQPTLGNMVVLGEVGA